jgi:hypothetical protein
MHRILFICKRSKIAALCISIETVKVSFFLSGVEVLQVLGVEVSQRRLDPVKCKIITIINYTKYLIIKLSIKIKP